MRHLGIDAKLLSRSCGITTANDGEGAAFGSLSNREGHGLGAFGKGIEFKDATGTVPDDGTGTSDRFFVKGNGTRTCIHPPPSL